MRRVAWGSCLAVLLFATGGARGDGGNRAVSTDALAKEYVDEFHELEKKDSLRATARRLEILDQLASAPCPTAQRFLLGLARRSSAPGDERFHAVRSLVGIADRGGLEDLLAALARAEDPTLWQGFGEALGDRPSESVRDWLHGPALDSPQPEVLCACLTGLARRAEAAPEERIAALYAKHAKDPAGSDVAHQALRALSHAKGPGARAALLDASRHGDWRLRLAAADALPSLEPFDAEVEAAVRGLLQDAEDPVRRTTVDRVGAAKRESFAAALVALVGGDPRVRTRHVAATALERISGQRLGHDAKAWAAWLEKRDPGKPESVTFPSYHGFSVTTDRVVFLVDASGSMRWPWRKPVHRIDVARSELASVLPRLAPDTLFNVIVFSDKVLTWKKAEVPATPENVAAAIRWAGKAMAEPDGDTWMHEALEAAFANNPRFDTIFFLTDGNPTAGKYWSNEALLASVRRWNRHRRTAIHAIGLSLANEDRGMPNLAEDLRVMAALLKALADETGGEFREVLQVPAKR